MRKAGRVAWQIPNDLARKTIMETTIQRIKEATKQAKSHGYSMAIVTVDHEDTRRQEIWSLGATLYAEFEASGGNVELIVHPNGEIEKPLHPGPNVR